MPNLFGLGVVLDDCRCKSHHGTARLLAYRRLFRRLIGNSTDKLRNAHCQTPEDEMSALIELNGISKDYGRFRALDNVSLSIGIGATGLLGPNGAGKSTLIKVLLGLVRTTSGEGRLLEYRIGRQNRKVRENVGYMPEDDCFLYGLTGIESVQLSAQLSCIPSTEALRRAHEILDFSGIEQERYRLVESYSTGMRQKLRFAQSIVHDPPIVILDEPTSGLDPEERQVMLNRIKRLSRDHQKAVILCTHILPDVQSVCDHVIILANGTVRVSDHLESLSQPTKPAMHVRLLGDQTGFMKRLRESNITVACNGNEQLTVLGEPDQLVPLIWKTAQEVGVAVRSLTPTRNSLEQIFLSAVHETSNESV